jgi:hypothetical protein
MPNWSIHIALGLEALVEVAPAASRLTDASAYSLVHSPSSSGTPIAFLFSALESYERLAGIKAFGI